jgi:predicted transcriptional regulator
LKTNMKFVNVLNALLSTLNISANRLSKAINVDSSLVNRRLMGRESRHITLNT